MTPWQAYLWRLQHPEAAERERAEDEPIVLRDVCPATDRMSLKQLLESAGRRKVALRNGEVPRPKQVRPSRLVTPDIRCAASINPQNGAVYAVGQQCRKRARLPGFFCAAHAGHAIPVAGEGS